MGLEMDNRLCRTIKILCIVWAAHTAFAERSQAVEPPEEIVVVPADNDPYLPEGPVNLVQEVDALRRHAVDLKYVVMFGTGILAGTIIMVRLI